MNLSQFHKPTFLLILLALSVLLYWEDRIYIGGVSLSNMWRFILLCGLTLVSVIALLRKKYPLLIYLLLAMPISLLITVNVPSIIDIEEFSVELFLPIIVISSASSLSSDNLEKMLLNIALVLALVSVPYYFNIFRPVELEINSILGDFAKSYGFDSDPLIAVFKHPSYAGKTLCTVVVILFFSSPLSLRNITFPILLIFTTYGIYLSYVRTAWLMLIIILIYTRRIWLAYMKRKLLLIPFLLSLVYVIMVVDYSMIINRVIGIRDSAIQVEYLTAISSGRDVLWFKFLNTVRSMSILELIMGLGKTEADKLLGGVAHNRFMELFLYGGLKTLLLAILVFRVIWKFARKHNDHKYRRLQLLTYLLLISYIPSHGFPFWSNVLLGLSISTIVKSDYFVTKG